MTDFVGDGCFLQKIGYNCKKYAVKPPAILQMA